jgi:hypothetical protein
MENTVLPSSTADLIVPASHDKKRSRFVCAGLFLAFAALYIATLCPTVYLGDSGEISLAIWSGGMIHPPGYPLFGLLGRSFLLLPFGEPAFRIGLITALAAAAAVAVLYGICRTLRFSVLASLCAAATFGTGYSFWSQSVRVEVYSLHVLLSALALLFALRYRFEGEKERDLYLCAAAVGVGLGHHLTIALILPALLIVVGKSLWTRPRLPLRLAALGGLLAIGPLLYFVCFPLWANDTTLHNWSRPSDFSGIVTHMSAKIFRGYLRLPNMAQIARVSGNALLWFGDSFLYIGALLAVCGAGLLWKRQPALRPAVGLIIFALTVTAYNLCYHILDIAGYFLVCWLVAAVFLAAAIDFVPTLLPRLRPAILAAFCIALPLVQAARNLPACNLHNVTVIREFARQKLMHCDQNAVLVTKGDDDVNELLYVQEALGVRRDVLLLDRDYTYGAWSTRDKDASLWYLYRLRHLGVDAPLTFPPDAPTREFGDDAYLIYLLTHTLKDRPLFTTFLSAENNQDNVGQFLRWIGGSYSSVPQGLVIRALPRGQNVSLAQLKRTNQRLWSEVTLPERGPVRTDQEMSPDYTFEHYATMLVNFGYLYELSKEPEKARKIYEIALAIMPDSSQARKSLADLQQRETKVAGRTP